MNKGKKRAAPVVTGENGAAGGIVQKPLCPGPMGPGPLEEKPGGDPTGDTLLDGRVAAHPPYGLDPEPLLVDF
jgi:hypothetical protein